MSHSEENIAEGINPNRERSRRISQNFFLHIHATRVHPFSLRPDYTFGLGIIAAFLFLTLILTGVFLMLYYTPSVERAYDSVKDISFVVAGGRYVRNIHRWASHGLVLVAFLHLIRTFYTGSYLRKRSLNWVIGVCMLLLTLFMSFSGYLLPWDQLAFWAVTIGSNIAASARELTDLIGITEFLDIGGFIKKLLIGDELVGQAALSRFFTLHVIFLPMTLLVLTGVHMWRIRKDGGLSRPDSLPPVEKLYSWPLVMWVELSLYLFVLVALLGMAFYLDAPLKEQANPAFPENPAKSPWYFLGIQELVSYSAFAGGLLIPLLFVAFLISIPYVDKEDQYIGMWFSGRKGGLVTAVSFILAASATLTQLYVLINFGWLRDWYPEIGSWVVMLVNPATLTAIFFVILSLLIGKITRSSRMAALSLFTAAMVGLVIFTAVGIWFRGPNWEFYWSLSQWPVL